MSDEAYALGDSDEAAARLKVAARLFEPEMTRFIGDAASPDPEVAVDLGCGPGYTTRLLQQTSGAALTVGVDRSEHFLRLAAESAPYAAVPPPRSDRGPSANRARGPCFLPSAALPPPGSCPGH